MGVRRLANPADIMIIKSSDLHEDLQRILSDELEHLKITLNYSLAVKLMPHVDLPTSTFGLFSAVTMCKIVSKLLLRLC